MLFRLIFLIALIAIAYYGYKKIQTLPPEQKRKVGWKFAIGGLIIISLLAVATGRMHWLGGALALLIGAAKFGATALFRFWPLLRATGRDAVFRTAHLEVRFLVKTSQLEGRVIKGLYEGELLHAMSTQQLQELAQAYQEQDKKSYYLVQVFLQRAGAAGAQQQYENRDKSGGGFPSSPTREEALLILGLSGNPDKGEIVAAHRKLIQKLHPDRGGNDYLAARINQAKDVLLSRTN